MNLHIGDTVSHDLIDYLVAGSVSYIGDSGDIWTDYQLEGDGDTWLVFEKDFDVVAVYKSMEINLTVEPPIEILYQGIVYYQREAMYHFES